MTNFDIIFLKPNAFEESLDYIEHMKLNRVIHINLSSLESEKAQRVLDFISGAAHIQEGDVINPGDKMYCILPKKQSYKLSYDEPKDTEIMNINKNNFNFTNDKNTTNSKVQEMSNIKIDEIEEIVPHFNKK